MLRLAMVLLVMSCLAGCGLFPRRPEIVECSPPAGSRWNTCPPESMP